MLRPGLVVMLALAGCGFNGNYRDTAVPMETVAVDPGRYAGRWYEVARFPNGLEDGCAGATAEYGLRADGLLSVRNACVKDGAVETVEGTARQVGPGRYKVKFIRWLPFAGDYWVLDVSPGYEVAVVGVPSGDFGWVLARTPEPGPEQRAFALGALRRAGYDTSRLIWQGKVP